jgi:hypothetical protein
MAIDAEIHPYFYFLLDMHELYMCMENKLL